MKRTSLQKNSSILDKGIKDLTYKKNPASIRTQTRHQPDIIEEVSTQELIQEKNDGMMKEYELVKNYNDNISNHHPSIQSYVPARNILIRVYRRMPIITDDGLMFNTPAAADFAKVSKTIGSGQTINIKEQLAQFNFTQKAVIVKLPKNYSGDYKVGQDVNIEQLLVQANKIDQTIYHEYMYQFIHPDANTTVPTSDCTDPFYGYALIPETIIKGYNE